MVSCRSPTQLARTRVPSLAAPPTSTVGPKHPAGSGGRHHVHVTGLVIGRPRPHTPRRPVRQDVWAGEQLRPVDDRCLYLFQLEVQWGQMMAYGRLITIPVLILLVCFQRAFIASIASSGVKG